MREAHYFPNFSPSITTTHPKPPNRPHIPSITRLPNPSRYYVSIPMLINTNSPPCHNYDISSRPMVRTPPPSFSQPTITAFYYIIQQQYRSYKDLIIGYSTIQFNPLFTTSTGGYTYHPFTMSYMTSMIIGYLSDEADLINEEEISRVKDFISFTQIDLLLWPKNSSPFTHPLRCYMDSQSHNPHTTIPMGTRQGSHLSGA